MQSLRQRGFTLVELMITVAIIAILATIAYPSYTQYVIRGHRAAAQSEMMDIANRQQQIFLANRGYASSIANLGYTLPSEVSTKYSAPTLTVGQTLNSSCAMVSSGTVPSFVITFAPISGSSQAADGNLFLSAQGMKCPADKWKK